MDHTYTAFELALGCLFIALLFAFGPFGQEFILRVAAGGFFSLVSFVMFFGAARQAV